MDEWLEELLVFPKTKLFGLTYALLHLQLMSLTSDISGRQGVGMPARGERRLGMVTITRVANGNRRVGTKRM